MQFNNSRETMTLKCINHKGSHAQVARQSKVRERKGELFFSSSAPPTPTRAYPTASSLNRAFACHPKWRWCQSITFLSSRRVCYSLSQTVLGIWRENSSYLHTKQRTLWLHVSFLTLFPLFGQHLSTFFTIFHNVWCNILSSKRFQ